MTEFQKWEETFSVVEPDDFLALKESLTEIMEDGVSILKVFIQDLASILYPFAIYKPEEITEVYLEPYLRAILDFLGIALVENQNNHIILSI